MFMECVHYFFHCRLINYLFARFFFFGFLLGFLGCPTLHMFC